MDFNRSVSVQGSSAGVAPGAVVSGVLAGASGHSLLKSERIQKPFVFCYLTFQSIRSRSRF
jgi:hypothetical protein